MPLNAPRQPYLFIFTARPALNLLVRWNLPHRDAQICLDLNFLLVMGALFSKGAELTSSHIVMQRKEN